MLDVELLRGLLLRLEQQQASPRAPVPIPVAREAAMLGTNFIEVRDGLDLLQQLDYIEGPGAGPPEVWLFRKLTSKGARFVKAARDPRDWERMKQSRKVTS